MSSFANARFLWEEGDARLRATRGRERLLRERVVEAIVADLRRRLGGPFRLEELVALHRQGTDWAQAVAVREAPDDPAAWDESLIAAAFWRYAREARDFAGGRHLGAA